MILNKDQKGSEELYQLTGTFAAGADFKAIEEDIYLAEQELIRFIGRALYDKAQNIYCPTETTSPPTIQPQNPSLDQQFVRRVQIPVAYRAMYHYYRRNVVSHDGSGRKLKVADGEKVPWSWMLERDDEMLLDNYYRNLDALFRFLEEQQYEEWKTSPLRKILANALIGSLADFEAVYPLDGSYYTFYTMLPFIKETEHRFITPLTEGVVLTEDQRADARRFVALHTMILAVERLSISAFPSGIAQRFTDSHQGRSGRSNPSLEEQRSYLVTLRRQADDALRLFKEGLSPAGEYPLTPHNESSNKFFTV